MLNTFSRRLILSHLVPVLLVVPLMGFAFEFLMGRHVLSSNPSSGVAGTLCTHFQSLAVPFAGVIILGLVFGSAVAWSLARALDHPVQKIIREIDRLAADKNSSPLKENGPKEIQTLVRAVNVLAQGHLDAEEESYPSTQRYLNLDQWLPQVLENWRKSANRRHLHWDVIVPANLPALKIDPDRLQPAMNCLLHNAIQSTQPGGKIRVRVKMVEQALCITIGDNVNGDQADPYTNFSPGNYIAPAVQERGFASEIHLFIAKDAEPRNTFMLRFPMNES